MIKDLLNANLDKLPFEGLDVNIIKRYIIESSEEESFVAKNLSILLVRSGRFKIKLQKNIKDLSSRDLIIIPKDSYCTVLEVHNKLQLFIMTISSEFAIKNFLKKELVDSFHFFLRNEPVQYVLEEREFLVLSLIYRLIYFVNKDYKESDFDAELKRISLNLFLYELKMIYSKYSDDTTANFNKNESQVIRFLTILSIHYKKQHHVRFYAGALHVTAGHLSKIVRNVTGKSVKILIIESLINEAKILLLDSQLTIAEIADELEFRSVSIFCIFFKKHTSFSPTEYRSNTIDRFKDQ
ncbi:helix-turn-helix transcriptional regulator [Flavobacterium sp. FlaQc-47]|uniref:helix-turn-helix transcriptional regulator n=1 Tax=Flavobacterium sp. FlaQc-47 TaxID=3374180 RepID=UPI0037567493